MNALRNTVFSKQVGKFLNSRYFVLISGAVSLISALFGLELFAFFYFAICTVIIALFCKTSKPLVPVVLLVTFSVSRKHYPSVNNPDEVGRGFLYDRRILTVIIVLFSVAMLAFILQTVFNKRIKAVFLRRTRLTVGLIAFLIGMCLNGLFADGYAAKNFLIGFIEGFSFLAVYAFFNGTLGKKKVGYDYYCKVCAVVLIVVLIQLFATVLPLIFSDNAINKGTVYLGWGVSNNIGCVIVLTIAPVMYLAYSDRHGYVYVCLAFMALAGVSLTLSRGSLIVACAQFVPLILFVLIKGRSKILNLVVTLLISATIGLCACFFKDKLVLIYDFFLKSKLNDANRFVLWRQAVDNFITAPIFGTGFACYSSDFKFATENFFFGIVTYHNTLLQILSSCGAIGIICYILTRVESFVLLLKRPTTTRLFALIGVCSFLLNCMLDNHYFYFYPTFFYLLNLVYAERDLNYSLYNKSILFKNKKSSKCEKRKTAGYNAIKR